MRGWPALLGVAATLGCGRVGFDDRSISGAQADAATEVDPTLLLWLPLDDDDPSAGAIDASGHGRDARCADAACPAAAKGRIGGAYELTAAMTQHLRITDDGSLRGLSQFTVSGWLRLTAARGASIASKPVGTDRANSFDLGTYSSAGEPAICTSDTPTGFGTCDLGLVPVPAGTWVHLAAVYDGNIRLYVDGVSVLEVSRTILWDANDLLVGCDLELGMLVACTDGAIDDIRLYGRALDAAEVAQLAAPD